jgi:hypothetical protein
MRSLVGRRACQRSRVCRHLHFSSRTSTSSIAGLVSHPSRTTTADQLSSVCWASDSSLASMDVRPFEGMMYVTKVGMLMGRLMAMLTYVGCSAASTAVFFLSLTAASCDLAGRPFSCLGGGCL